MVEFINIQQFTKYISILNIKKSFGINRQLINKEFFQDIENINETDENLINLFENNSQYMVFNLNTVKIN